MNEFEECIKEYMDNRAQQDAQFAEIYKNADKSIEKCCQYIIQEVRQSGRQGFADMEIYSMAMHYYDEENIKVGTPIKCKVVVNKEIKLSDAEKSTARENAIRQYQQEELLKIQMRNCKRKVAKQQKSMPSLFD
jgi:hypothetical protein